MRAIFPKYNHGGDKRLSRLEWNRKRHGRRPAIDPSIDLAGKLVSEDSSTYRTTWCLTDDFLAQTVPATQ